MSPVPAPRPSVVVASSVTGGRRRPRRVLAASAGAALAGILLTGCGLGTAGGYVPSGKLTGDLSGVDLSGADLAVGSKNFTEQQILGKMAVVLLQSAGADVEDLTQIPGSNSMRQAALKGIVDVTWDYTGTGWITYLGNTDPLPDARAQYEATRDADAANGQVWLEPGEVDNTYALATTRAFAEASGVDSIGDIAGLPEEQQTFCLDAEFASRNDGFEPMLEVYGVPAVSEARLRLMDLGAVYQATANGECSFGEVFATDGRVPGLDLVVLEDEQEFFPKYNLAPVVGEEVLAEHPEIGTLLSTLNGRLDNQTMADLNARVDMDGEDPTGVAFDFLVSEGLITE